MRQNGRAADRENWVILHITSAERWREAQAAGADRGDTWLCVDFLSPPFDV
jgi:hypothetical protein